MTTQVTIKNSTTDGAVIENHEIVIRWATKDEKGNVTLTPTASILAPGEEATLTIWGGYILVIEER